MLQVIFHFEYTSFYRLTYPFFNIVNDYYIPLSPTLTIKNFVISAVPLSLLQKEFKNRSKLKFDIKGTSNAPYGKLRALRTVRNVRTVTTLALPTPITAQPKYSKYR